MYKKVTIKLIELATISRKHFFYYVNKCNKIYRSGHDLDFYRDLIEMHRKTEDLSILLKNDNFLLKIYNTLEVWDMNKKGARMTSFDDLKKSIKSRKDYLVELYNFKII